jgi:hypothetical protein
MDGKSIMVIFGLFMLGFFSKDIIMPVCDITEDVVDDLDDDLEHIIQEQKRKQHLLLLFLGLLSFGYFLMTMNRNEQSGGARKSPPASPLTSPRDERSLKGNRPGGEYIGHRKYKDPKVGEIANIIFSTKKGGIASKESLIMAVAFACFFLLVLVVLIFWHTMLTQLPMF